MHVIFMPYGRRQLVEDFLRDMEATPFKHVYTKGDEKKETIIKGAIRVLPFGVYEYIFPKDYLQPVLNSLRNHKNRYMVPEYILKIIRKVLKCKKIPKITTKEAFPWVRNHVNIVPVGIREDIIGEITTESEIKGYTAEFL